MFRRIKEGASSVYARMLMAMTAMIVPGTSFAAGSGGDVEALSHPLKVAGKLMVVMFGLIYILVGFMWMWLPAVVAFMIYKYYHKKADQGQDDVTGDMNKAMFIGVVISIGVSFVIIGFLGNLFFGQGANTDLIQGIKSYYGNFLTNIRDSFQQVSQ